MPNYIPINTGVEIESSLSDIERIETEFKKLIIYIVIPNFLDSLLKIEFAHFDVFRVLDELFLSTEDEITENTGIISDHLAYIVEESLFFKNQSPLVSFQNIKRTHYRFVTGGGCMDVITPSEPCFSVVPCPTDPSSVQQTTPEARNINF